MEQNNQVNLSQLTETQLKAFAYDEMGKIEMAQNNLRILNQELTRRQSVSKVANDSQLSTT